MGFVGFTYLIIFLVILYYVILLEPVRIKVLQFL